MVNMLFDIVFIVRTYGARVILVALLSSSYSLANAETLANKDVVKTAQTQRVAATTVKRAEAKVTTPEEAKRQKAAVLLFLKAITGTKL